MQKMHKANNRKKKRGIIIDVTFTMVVRCRSWNAITLKYFNFILISQKEHYVLIDEQNIKSHIYINAKSFTKNLLWKRCVEWQ